jgi:hypothetical protein
MSESKNTDFQKIFQEIGKFTQKVNSLGKAVDFLHEELTPKVFKEKTTDLFEFGKKMVDNFLNIL